MFRSVFVALCPHIFIVHAIVYAASGDLAVGGGGARRVVPSCLLLTLMTMMLRHLLFIRQQVFGLGCYLLFSYFCRSVISTGFDSFLPLDTFLVRCAHESSSVRTCSPRGSSLARRLAGPMCSPLLVKRSVFPGLCLTHPTQPNEL